MRSDSKLSVEETEKGATVTAAGEIDISNIETFREAIRNAEDLSDSDVAINLCDVSFIDTAGLAELIASAKRLRAKQKVLQVCVKESAQPDYVLKTTGLDAILHICYPEGNDN